MLLSPTALRALISIEEIETKDSHCQLKWQPYDNYHFMLLTH